MKYTVLGKRIGNFTDKKTGEVVNFGKVYVSYPDDYVDGLCVEDMSVKPDRLSSVSVGDVITVDRNKYGKIIGLDVV